MAGISTKRVRNWVTILMLVVFVASLAAWFFRLESLPNKIRIATGEPGGLYFTVGTDIADSIHKRTGSPVSIESTPGSEENFERLLLRNVELAIVQGGAVPIQDVSVVTPLFPELVFVVVRKGSNINSVSDLVGKTVAIGKEGSGNRSSALKVLRHFGIGAEDLTQTDDYFKRLLDEKSSIDAAIVTAGIVHPDLREVLKTHRFELVPIRSAKAIDMVHPFLRNTEIPRGLFAEHPPVPAEPVSTIATTAYLVANNDAPDRLVRAALESIHEESLRLHVPSLVPRQDAAGWNSTRLHPVAQRYFNPSDNIGHMANVMESLAATKELLFALGAGVYILWIRWRRLKEKESQELLNRQKDRLDGFLEQTLHIEEAQMKTDDPAELKELLDQVTRIKLKALYEFTDEQLRSDQSFSIFLDQCSGLMNKIQLKTVALTT